MEPIEIPRDVAEAEGVPDDLDSSIVGPYQFPNPRRRRLAGIIYLVGALLGAVGVVAGLVPGGVWLVVGALLLMAIYNVATAWNMTMNQEDALDTAAGRVDFAVGHASAAVGFVGWRSRPVWNVILYSATEPPDRRALVRLDGLDGSDHDEVFVEQLTTA